MLMREEIIKCMNPNSRRSFILSCFLQLKGVCTFNLFHCEASNSFLGLLKFDHFQGYSLIVYDKEKVLSVKESHAPKYILTHLGFNISLSFLFMKSLIPVYEDLNIFFPFAIQAIRKLPNMLGHMFFNP